MNKPTKNKSLTLFELVTISSELKDRLIENEGELTESLERELVRNGEELENKALAYAFTIDSLKADIEQLQDMEKQISQRKKALESSVKRIKGALLAGLTVSEVKKIEGPSYRITVGKKRAFVNYDSEEVIANKYKKVKVSFEFSKSCKESFDRLVEYHLNTWIVNNDVSQKEVISIDKMKVLSDLKEGALILGAQLIENEKQLYIK